MDKREATLTLTERLQQLGYVRLVPDTAVKSYLLDNAKSAVLDLADNNPEIIDFHEIDLSKDTRCEEFSKLKEKYPQANYLFAEGNKTKQEEELRNTLIMPTAIIGESEEEILKREYYKDVPYLVRRSLEVLEIPNFIEAYEVFSSLSSDDIDIKKLQSQTGASMRYTPFKDGDTIEIGDVIQGTESKNYYVVKKIQITGISGPTYRDAELKNLVSNDSSCPHPYIKPTHKSDPKGLLEFMEFVFSLPSEDQNIDINEKLLKYIPNSNTVIEILYNEYIKGHNFSRYFNAVNETVQKETFTSLKSIHERKPIYDKCLWDNGFKEVNLDYMNLYQENAEGFIDYFSSREKKEKKTILKDIMDCDYTNKSIGDWLDENERDILREVSMDG